MLLSHPHPLHLSHSPSPAPSTACQCSIVRRPFDSHPSFLYRLAPVGVAAACAGSYLRILLYLSFLRVVNNLSPSLIHAGNHEHAAAAFLTPRPSITLSAGMDQRITLAVQTCLSPPSAPLSVILILPSLLTASWRPLRVMVFGSCLPIPSARFSLFPLPPA